MDGGLGVAAQSIQQHIIPPIVGVNYTKNTQNSPQLSTKATVTEEQKKECFRFV